MEQPRRDSTPDVEYERASASDHVAPGVLTTLPLVAGGAPQLLAITETTVFSTDASYVYKETQLCVDNMGEVAEINQYFVEQAALFVESQNTLGSKQADRNTTNGDSGDRDIWTVRPTPRYLCACTVVVRSAIYGDDLAVDYANNE